MSSTVRIEHVVSRPFAVVRRRVAPIQLPTVVPQACGLVWATVKAAQVKGGRQIAIYRDAPDGLLDVEVGVEVNTPFPDHGNVVASVTCAGNAATITHFGPYGKLAQAHQSLREWCSAAGHPLAGPRWEIYGHWLPEWNNNPAQIRTDIFYLLQS